MTTTTIGAAANYNTQPGLTTDNEPYSIAFDRFVFRAETQQQLDNFLAWLGNLAGKPVDQLGDMDVLRHVKLKDLSNGISNAGPNGTVHSYALKQSNTDSVNLFNDMEYFGDTIPRLTSGTGTFIGAPMNLPTGLGSDASTGGFAGTAQKLFSDNYPAGSDMALDETELAALNPEVLQLMQEMFGSNTPLSLEHMNVLKMMGLLTGKADEPASTWAVTAAQGQTLLNAFMNGSDTFIDAISLLNLKGSDIALANGARDYFDQAGNLVQGFGTANVEKVAAQLVDTMSPPETAMPSNIEFGINGALMLNHLFGLGESNANYTFTVEQVNTALAMGLLNYDNGNRLNITNSGRGYFAAKEAENAPPVIEKPVHIPPLRMDAKADAFLSALLNLEGHGNVYEIFDEGKHGKGSNGKISTGDIESLANKDPYNNSHWKNDQSKIPIELRVKVVALARYAVDNGVVRHLWNNEHHGQRYDKVIESSEIRGSGNGGPIDWYVAALPADRPTLHFEQVGNGYTNTARVVEKRGGQAVTP